MLISVEERKENHEEDFNYEEQVEIDVKVLSLKKNFYLEVIVFVQVVIDLKENGDLNLKVVEDFL